MSPRYMNHENSFVNSIIALYELARIFAGFHEKRLTKNVLKWMTSTAWVNDVFLIDKKNQNLCTEIDPPNFGIIEIA